MEEQKCTSKAPRRLQPKIIGTWSGGYQEDGDSSFHRVSYAKDGTMTYEDIWIGEDGFQKTVSKQMEHSRNNI